MFLLILSTSAVVAVFKNQSFFFCFVFLFRSLDTDLDDLSCTDVEQQWGAMKKSTLGDYEAKRLTEFCHAHSQKDVYATKMPEVTPAMEKKWRDRLVVCKRF